MKKGYNYQNKIRKEVWLTQTVIGKLQKKADKKYSRKNSNLKPFLEFVLEEGAK